MLENFKKPAFLLLFLIVLALLLRVFNLSSPAFTADEARIAFRAFTLAQQGRDELGRSFPFVFNSLVDYQLPVTSYIAALGVFLFGKTDIGVRIPFVILSIALVVLTYKIAQLFSPKKKFWVVSSLVMVFSPVLIFLSKVPNDSIVLTFLITLLFYLLTREKPNKVFIIISAALTLLVSKFSWFIIVPFVIFTLVFYQTGSTTTKLLHALFVKNKIKVVIFVFLLTCTVVAIFLRIPQSQRSLSENNLSILSSITIKNGINQMRGEGINSGWPVFLEVALFNKADILIIGFINWLSNLQPGIYFGQLDESGQLNFSQMGALNKVLIVPFIFGITYLIRQGRKKEKFLFGYIFILSFPALFIYPGYSPSLIVLTLPFVALIIAFGFMRFSRTVSVIVILTMVLEIGLNLINPGLEKKNTNLLRPSWVKVVSQDLYKESIKYNVAISDDITSDIISFIEWYNPLQPNSGYLDVPYPYKFHQSSIKNTDKSIKIIGSDNKVYGCKDKVYKRAIISQRDRDKLRDYSIKIISVYKDSLNKEIAYLMEQDLCIERT